MDKSKRLEMKMQELEEKIAQVQKSTRTLIPAFIPIHNQFRSQFRWYYNWHLTPFSSLIHWITLFSSVMLFFLIVLGLVVTPPAVKVEAVVTTYTHSGITNPSSTHIARKGTVPGPGAGDPTADQGTEFTSTEYTDISSSNDVRVVQFEGATQGPRAFENFRFTISETPSTVTQLDFKVEGQTDTGMGGFHLHIWNKTTVAWEQVATTSTTGSDVALTATKTTGITDYIDTGGLVREMVSANTVGCACNMNMDYAELKVSVQTVPAAPTNFAGTANSTSQITWSWTDNATNESGYRVMDSAGTTNLSGDLAANTTSWAETLLSVNTQYTRRARAFITAEGTADSANASRYTLSNVPSAPTVATVSTTSVSVDVNVNSNPAATTFAIQETGSSNYVQAGGTLGASAVWQTDSTWGTITITGLSVNTQYTFQVKARNGDNTETAFGSTAAIYAYANIPSLPTVTSVSNTSAKVVINVNSNPSATQFAIQETTGSQYVQTSGALGASAAWQTYTQWGGTSGINVTGLTANIEYKFQVKARNGDNVETNFSSGASLAAHVGLYTFANISNPSSTQIARTGVCLGESDPCPGGSDHPSADLGTEAATAGYSALTSSDSTADSCAAEGSSNGRLCKFEPTTSGPEAFANFRFTISETPADVTQLDFKVEGFVSSVGAGGIWLHVWNKTTSTWTELTNTTTIGSDVTLTASRTTGITDYIDTGGLVRVLAKTTNVGCACYLGIDYAEVQARAPRSLSTPTGFSGTANSNSQITWSWTDNATNENGYRCLDTSNTNKSGDLSVNISSWSETLLSVNTQYTRKIQVYSTGGTTGDSATASRYTLANVPSKPTVSSVSGNDFKVTLDVNSNPSATQFAIQETGTGKYVQTDGSLGASANWQNYSNWGGSSGKTITVASADNPFKAYAVTGTFQVKARNGDNIETSFGDPASATSPSGGGGGTTLSAPTGLAVSDITTTTAKATWNSVTDATSYDVSYGTDSNAATTVVNVSTTNYTLTGLSANTTYYVKIRAKNSTSTSSYSSIVSFTTKAESSPDGTGGAENKSPTAKILGPQRVLRDTEITLDASQSSDPDGTIVKYKWTFGDETITAPTQPTTPTTTQPTTPEITTAPTQPSPTTSETTPTQPKPQETAPAQPQQPKVEPKTVTEEKPAGVLQKTKNATSSVIKKIKDFTTKSFETIRGFFKRLLSSLVNSSLASTETTEAKIKHSYKVTGRYSIALIVEDNGGKEASTSFIVEVVPHPPVIDKATVNTQDVLEISGVSADLGVITLYLQSQPIAVITSTKPDGTFKYDYQKASLDFSTGAHDTYGRVTDLHDMTSDPSNTKDFQIPQLPSLALPDKPASALEKQLQKIWQPETVESSVKTIVQLNTLLKPIALLVGLLAILLSAGWWEIPWLLYYLFVSFLEFIGVRKKPLPWGVIYDAQTKAPVFLAVVRIFSAKDLSAGSPHVEAGGHGKKLLETRVTDRQGRFGFTVDPGEYYITVTKNGYTFASKLVSPKTKQDDVYTNLYHGAVLAISPESKGVVNVNVPIDPLSEQALTQLEKKLPAGLRILKRTLESIRVFTKNISLPILIAATTAAVISLFLFPEIYTPIFVLLYILILYREFKDRQQRDTWGVVYNSATKQPIARAIVRIFDVDTKRLRETKVTTSSGQFGFIVSPGKYYLEIQKEGYQFPSKEVDKKNDGVYHGVYTGGEIAKRKTDAFLAVNVPLDPA